MALGLGLAAGPTGAGAAETLPPLVTSLETLTDGTADDVIAEPPAQGAQPQTPPPLVRGRHPRADITQASLEYAPGWIRMRVQVTNPTDPLKDPAWSDRSDAEWALDTNGDGQPDHTVEFATDQGELYGAVFDVTKPHDKALCEADSASFSRQDGYTLVIDPKCIGNPKTVGYSVAMFIDTNPKDENVPLAVDRVPDEGFKVVAAPVQPGDPSTRAPASAGKPTTPAQAPPAAPPGAPATGRRPASASSEVPGAAGAEAPAGQPGMPVGEAAPPRAPASPLARTGSPTTERSLFGLGILLVGAGLMVMTRPAQRLISSGV